MQLRHLEEAEQHVVRGERLISEQKVRIANLERDGHDSTTARELLETIALFKTNTSKTETVSLKS